MGWDGEIRRNLARHDWIRPGPFYCFLFRRGRYRPARTYVQGVHACTYCVQHHQCDLIFHVPINSSQQLSRLSLFMSRG